MMVRVLGAFVDRTLGPFPPPLRGRVREGGRAAVAALLLLASSSAFAQSTFTPRDESPEEFAAGAGRDETFYACTACHNFKLVAAQGLTRAGWEESLNLMVRKHNMPALDDKDRDVVLNYLETAYPPRAPAAGRGWQNPFMKK
jgi:mono/diheme cytochrome c family protein